MAFLPRESAEVLRREIAAGRGPVDMHTCQRAILARLRTMPQEDFLPYDGGGEGLYRRFYRAVRQAADIDGLLEAARTRRYPMARLRRMLLAAYLELPEPEHIPYLRLLAASRRGCDLLAADARSAGADQARRRIPPGPSGPGSVHPGGRVDRFVYSGVSRPVSKRLRRGLAGHPMDHVRKCL